MCGFTGNPWLYKVMLGWFGPTWLSLPRSWLMQNQACGLFHLVLSCDPDGAGLSKDTKNIAGGEESSQASSFFFFFTELFTDSIDFSTCSAIKCAT